MGRSVAVFTTLACVIPALALAAHPAKNAEFAWCPKTNKCPITFATSRTGKKIIELRMSPKCAPIPPDTKAGYYPNMTVSLAGKFAQKGTLRDVLGRKIHYMIAGKFKRPKKAVGHFHVTAEGCKDSRHKFVARGR